MTLRLRGSKTELEEMGEDVSDMATTTSALQAKLLALTGGQVDIMLDANTFKNSTQILREMAAAWEDMNDIQRASALELMGGKRQANVLSALIQNFDTVEKVIETSANSAGSALKENERYLDSIQGKIDQFNNAMQTIWSNLLDSDVVKTFVEWGTKIIQSLDTVQGKFLAIAKVLAIFMAFKKVNPLDFIKDVSAWMSTIKDGGGLMQYLKSLLGLAPAMKVVTAETIANTVATQMNDAAKAKQMISDMGLAQVTGTLSAAQKEQAATAILSAISTGQLTMAQGNAMLAMLGYSGATMAADGSLKVLDTTTKSFMASNPVGWILAIVSVVVVLVTLLSKIPSKLERLEEKMSELNSEISSLESEIDSLNDELETTQERIAELLAMPSLSFVEQEELKNLQLQNAELEKQLELQEMLLESKKKDRISTSKEWVQNAWNGEGLDQKYFVSGNGTIGEDKWFAAGTSGKEALEASLPKYAELQKNMEDQENVYLAAQEELNDNGKLSYETFKGVVDALPDIGDNPEAYYDQKIRYSDEKLVGLFKQNIIDQNNNTIDNMTSGIEMVLGDMSKVISENELSYSMGDEDVNKFLDEYFAYQYAYQEAQGISAKSSAIASIFDDTSSDSIKKLKEDLSEIAGDDTLDAAKKQENALALVNKAINSTSGEYDRLKTSMDIVGITADEVARYFTQMSSMPDSSTVEGLTAQYQKGVEALSKYQGVATDIIAEFTDLDGSVEQITWGSLFDENGETIDTQISKVLQGANETTRTEFARIAKSVNEGTMSIETAMSSFSGSGLVAVSKLIEESFGELNKSVFKGLEDEISGFIDTFSEFSAALEDVASSMDLLHTAQEQMDSSGQISLKTALELVESTDQWNKMLTVENGKIKLVAGAEDVLAQTKLNTVKANLAEAKASIQNQLAQLGAADATLLSAEASDITAEAYTIYTNAMNSYTASIAGFGAALDALVNKRVFGEDGIIGSFQSAYDAAKQVTTYENNTNIAALRQQLADVNQMEDFFEVVDTTQEFKNNYDFDESPGDKYGEDETSEFQRQMELFENRIAAEQAKYERIQSEIDLLEAKGKTAGKSFYDAQIASEEERLVLLQQQQNAVNRRLKEVAPNSEEWWEAANMFDDIQNEIDGVALSIQNLKNTIIDKAHSLVDDVQSVYDTLIEAEQEYQENGYISVDTLQSLLELEPKYLDMLVNENGDLVVNRKTLQKVAKARVIDMGIKQQSAVLEEALALATSGSRNELLNYIATMETAQEVGADWIEVQLKLVEAALDLRVAEGELSQVEADAFVEGIRGQVGAIEVATRSAVDNIENSLSSAGNSATEKTKNDFQKMMDYWENRIGANQAKYEQIQNEIDLLEKQGKRAGADYYQEQIKLEEERRDLLEQQKAAATAFLNQFVEGSEEWWDAANALNDIQSELDDVTASIQDLRDAMAQIHWDNLEEFGERISNLHERLSDIRDVLSSDDMFNDEGEWTEAGVATLGTYIQEIEMYKNQLKEIEDELADFGRGYQGNEKYFKEMWSIDSEQEYYDKLIELHDLQAEYTKGIHDSEESVVEMYENQIEAIEEYTETLIEGYSDYIEGVKEALNAERDLYNFKKNVKKQSKDIIALQRRVISLTGSTNASDIAERRKLEAELYEAREALNETYYDHAQDTQNEALENEQRVYEDTMHRFVEGVHQSLHQATKQMSTFIQGVTTMVMYNADTILQKYEETKLPLTEELTNPWEEAKKAVADYSGNALELMSEWLKDGGFFGQFNDIGTKFLTSPWDAGTMAVQNFASNVSAAMRGVVADISTNVENSKGQLADLYAEIQDTNAKLSNVGGSSGGAQGGNGVSVTTGGIKYDGSDGPSKNAGTGNGGTGTGSAGDPGANTAPPLNLSDRQVNLRPLMQTSREMILGPKDFVDANTVTLNGVKYYRDKNTGYYYKISDLDTNRKYDGGRSTGWAIPKGTWFYTVNPSAPTNQNALGGNRYITAELYAKGTMGTTRDQWAITNEPQFGDELAMYATPEGTLSFMRAGSTVVPADITANLVEWGKLSPDMLNVNGTPNINMISNAVNKPELNITFDSLVKAENITEETLPAVKKLVTQELNRFTKELNYALKGKGAR